MSLAKTFLALAMAASSAYAGFASTTWDISQEDNTTSATIQYLATTLQVPDVPSQQGLFLWPGMYSQDDQLVQTILTNDPQYVSGACGQPDGTNVWCVQSFQYSGSLGSGMGSAVAVNVGDMLDIVYTYDSSVGNTTQTTTRQSDGAVLTSLSWAGGPGYNLADSIECHQPIDSTPEHYYYNTQIVLSQPNCGFNTTLNAANSSPSSFASTDDCTTWEIDQIVLGASSCQCNPTGDC